MKPNAEVMVFPVVSPSYIQKDYKTRMLMKFGILALSGTAAFCALFYFNLNRKMAGGYVSVLDGMRFIKGSILQNFIFTESVILLFLGSGVIILTLLMSHRIAGPLFRLERTARAVGAGDLKSLVKLRDKDQLKELADQMNLLIAGLYLRVADIKAAYSILEADVLLLESRAGSADCTSDAECAAILRDVLENTRDLKMKLAAVRMN